jgi:RNA polymerase sigma-70 factor (ECF subfamily)
MALPQPDLGAPAARQPVEVDRPSKIPGDVTADLDLARRCRDGDAGAFEAIYRQHAGRLYNLAVRMSGSVHEAEDLLQEVFLQAYRKMGSYRGEASLGTWLYRLGVNHCLDRLRGRRAKQERVTDSLDVEGRPEPAAAPAAALAAVSRMDLERAIGQLPDGSRAAFLLHDVEGFEHREIAAMLGVAVGTSKSQVHKARLRLRRILADADAANQ